MSYRPSDCAVVVTLTMLLTVSGCGGSKKTVEASPFYKADLVPHFKSFLSGYGEVLDYDEEDYRATEWAKENKNHRIIMFNMKMPSDKLSALIQTED